MLATSSDDVRYADVNMMFAGAGTMDGEPGIRQLCAGFADFASTNMGVISKHVSDDRRHWATEWEWHGTRTDSDKSFKVRGASVGTLDADGRVASQTDYWNPAHLEAQVGPMMPSAAS